MKSKIIEVKMNPIPKRTPQFGGDSVYVLHNKDHVISVWDSYTNANDEYNRLRDLGHEDIIGTCRNRNDSYLPPEMRERQMREAAAIREQNIAAALRAASTPVVATIPVIDEETQRQMITGQLTS